MKPKFKTPFPESGAVGRDNLFALLTDLNARPPERKLWKELRIRNIGGEKFLRQFPIFVRSDFGRKVHLLKKDYDANRDLVMNELWFNVLRFTYEQVANNLNEVIEKIMFYVIA